MDAQELFDQLSVPFPPELIEWRVGATRKPYDNEIKDKTFGADDTVGKALCYIDARTAMDRLDSVCGPTGWQCTYSPGVNGSIICNLGIKCDGEWVWKADGAGATDFEGEKGALSDAFKRAAVRWGLGRYLYDIDAPPVALDKGKYIGAQAKRKLAGFYDEEAPKANWGVRAGVQAFRLMKKIVLETVTDAAMASDFKTKNKTEINALPVAMRTHLLTILDRVGSRQLEAAE